MSGERLATAGRGGAFRLSHLLLAFCAGAVVGPLAIATVWLAMVSERGAATVEALGTAVAAVVAIAMLVLAIVSRGRAAVESSSREDVDHQTRRLRSPNRDRLPSYDVGTHDRNFAISRNVEPDD